MLSGHPGHKPLTSCCISRETDKGNFNTLFVPILRKFRKLKSFSWPYGFGPFLGLDVFPSNVQYVTFCYDKDFTSGTWKRTNKGWIKDELVPYRLSESWILVKEYFQLDSSNVLMRKITQAKLLYDRDRSM